MAKYEVLNGTHFGEDNKKYTKGDTVETDQPLDKMFPDRFLRTDIKRAKGQKKGGGPDHDQIIADAKAALERARAAKRAKANQAPKEGEEDDEEPTPKGEDSQVVVKSVTDDQDESVDDDDEDEDEDKEESEDEEEEDEEEEDEEPSRAQKQAKKLGEDVTTKFPSAKKKGLSVHLTKDGDYQVAKKGKIVEGGESLSRGKVQKFVTKHKG